MAKENLVLTQEKKEELERTFGEIAGDVASGCFDFDEAEVDGFAYLRAVEEYETPNFTVKIEVKGGVEEGAPGEPGEGA